MMIPCAPVTIDLQVATSSGSPKSCPTVSGRGLERREAKVADPPS
jgi:hypothetical protein